MKEWINRFFASFAMTEIVALSLPSRAIPAELRDRSIPVHALRLGHVHARPVARPARPLPRRPIRVREIHASRRPRRRLFHAFDARVRSRRRSSSRPRVRARARRRRRRQGKHDTSAAECRPTLYPRDARRALSARPRPRRAGLAHSSTLERDVRKKTNAARAPGVKKFAVAHHEIPSSFALRRGLPTASSPRARAAPSLSAAAVRETWLPSNTNARSRSNSG